jgi:hypothetical protein
MNELLAFADLERRLLERTRHDRRNGGNNVTGDGDLVFATDVGVILASAEAHEVVTPARRDLSKVVIDDLAYPGVGQSVAATHSRGLWRIATP